MLGLDQILSEEKLSRLEAMAEQMDEVADKMQNAANTALAAAEEMTRAAETLDAEKVRPGSAAA